MNLEELQSVQSQERANSSLQNLRETFYSDVGRYIQELKDERSRIADQVDDPFGSPEVRRLTDEVETAEEVAEAIYERRMGKLVKQASLAAAGMSADTEGLTREEQELFDALVARIEDNKARVLDVLAGKEVDAPIDTGEGAESATETDDPPAPPEPAPTDAGEAGVDAADLMGSGPDETDSAPETPDSSGETDRADPSTDEPEDPIAAAERERARESGDPAVAEEGDEEELIADGASPAPGDAPAGTGEPAPEDEGEERTSVLITQDLGEIYGVDDREYTLTSDDVVSLPTQNADPLVERGAAKRLD